MKKKGFSLIELAIVIMVIGILTATIIATKSIVDSSKIARAITLTSSSNIINQEGLILWLETSNLTRRNPKATTITEWRDMGPYSMVFKNANTSTIKFKKSNEISALKAMHFSGEANSFKITDTFPMTSEYTAFVVSVPESTSGYLYSNLTMKLLLTEADIKKIVIVKNDGTNKYIKLSRNHSFSQISNNESLEIPSYYFDIGYKMQGYIYEIIIFNRILSDNDIGRIETYLYNKYTK